MQTPVEAIKQIKENKKSVEFLPTGFYLLDEFLDGGFMRKELIVLGAYTGIGKSIFAGNILFNIAKKGFTTAYFSLEISNVMLVSRLVGAIANIKPTRLIAGWLHEDENKRRFEAEAEVEQYDSLISLYDDLYNFEKIKQEILQHKYEFVVIDFIQNIISIQRDEYERLSLLALQFQQLAKETNSCIMLVSQISNEAAKHGSLEYKGSGSIATVCDLGFFITRINPIEEEGNNDVKLTLRKNRRGISGKEFQFTFTNPGGALHEKQ